jgi:hypothetical protein
MTISEPSSRIRIFINLPKDSDDWSNNLPQYLGSISTLGNAEGGSYIFNFTDYLDSFPKEHSINLLKEDIVVTLTAVTLKDGTPVKQFKVEQLKCTLEISL